MPAQFKLVGVGLVQPPEPDTNALPSLQLLWPTVDEAAANYNHNPLIGLRCLKDAATTSAPVTSQLTTISSEIASQVVKIVSPSDERLRFSLALALLKDGSVIYLSSSKRFHLKTVEFNVPTAAATTSGEGGSAPTTSSTSSDSVKIVDIAAGATHFLACDSTHHAWAWGWGNEWGQFGQGSIWKSISERNPNEAMGSMNAEEAAEREGPRRTASIANAKFKEGAMKVISFFQQRALSDIGMTVARPTHIKAFGSTYGRVGVSAVAAGRFHSIFLTENRKNVFTCGWGEKGQLGQGKSVFLTPTPKSIMRLFGCSVAAIAAASNSDHTHLLLDSGKVLAFGDNTSGVLGTGNRHCEWAPARMAFHSAASAGLAGIKELCVANVKNHAAAQAPYGSPESFLYPKRAQQITQSLSPSEPATDVLSTSATHTFLRTSEGVLYSCGQRPVKVVNPLSVINVDAIGALGRFVGMPQEGLVLEECAVETGPNAVPVAGQGFTVFMDGTGSSYTAHFVGAIFDKKGKVVLASGTKGALSNGSMPIAFEGLVRNVFPVLGGAIALVQV